MIVVCGSINMDVTAYCSSLPRPGETVHGSRYLTGLGGKGANQAAAAARLGALVRMVGRVGPDTFGNEALARLKSFGVEADDVSLDAGNRTGIAVINVAADGQNSITVVGGANMAMDETDATRAASVLGMASVLLLQLEIPVAASLAAASLARKAQGIVLLDPAPAAETLQADLYRAVDIITPNETEARTLTGIDPVDEGRVRKAADRLHERGARTVVMKLGSRGAYFSQNGLTGFVPAFPVNVVDTVAAGDCFNGGLAYALANGRDLAGAVRFASATGALATTRFGAADAAPDLHEVERLLAAR
jgi:ribokinase